ncbi:MAG: prephenate dehydrogenase/arogenate dehydrogenase family protein [Gemmatimonadetes bacterium]|nr:prephenate dehydrogenase/arogenate dehydrogenase family protein [Gemmatimonadota bacterium]
MSGDQERTVRPERLGVIGLGAIGGSLAWQCMRAGVPHVIAHATSAEDVTGAVEAGAVTHVVDTPEDVIAECDLAVLAVPPSATLELLSRLAEPIRAHGVRVTDVCSVKRAVVDRARELDLHSFFVGSHPFCGTHQSGFAGARDDLFRDSIVYVTPVNEGDEISQEIVTFWRDVLHASPVVMPAGPHDEMLAWTSHLPQVVSSALAVALAEGAPDGATYGTGARDTTRLAASNTTMWRDILMLNRSPIEQSLDTFARSVDTLKRALADEDAAAVAQWLDRGAEFRRRLAE